ncbi:uncharacterized protein LOC112532107 isoform X2 [Gallus gallus]|uniref:uncharacterized protein LOC112532107 isoform X2 n=1 Tax=Gallus gallus TaxID=9031 RepID=UPI001AEA8997|nr:uncharacterized protein LOC112532107 isoform X2 [Gallus gallus]
MPRGSLETEVKGWSERGTGKAQPPHVVLGRLLSTLCTDVKGYGFPADFSKREHRHFEKEYRLDSCGVSVYKKQVVPGLFPVEAISRPAIAL